MNRKGVANRRDFLKTLSKSSLALGTGAAFPTVVPHSVLGQDAPSNRVTVGMIGCGWRGMQLFRDVYNNPNLRIAAFADVDRRFVLNAQATLDGEENIQRSLVNGTRRALPPKNASSAYEDYRRILDRDDIDAVVVATPDHWHAKIAIDAMDAGKDVYCEKPLSHTINQGRDLVRKARETKSVFQTGSQQRSSAPFRTIAEYARAGRIGRIDWARVVLSDGTNSKGGPDEPVPAGLNWDSWLGPAPYVPYNPLRCHISFRNFFDYSGGSITDLGAHHLDIVQWALGTDRTGPISVEGKARTRRGFFETFSRYYFTFTYASGIKVYLDSRHDEQEPFSIQLHGSKGSLHAKRWQVWSDPPELLQEPLGSGDPHLYRSGNHMQDWVDCIRERRRPICDVAVGHRTATLCHLANICGRIRRNLQWDPEQELFPKDTAANDWLERPQREPYVYTV